MIIPKPKVNKYCKSIHGMTEAAFWNIIALLDWEKSGDDEAVLLPAIEALSQFSKESIKKFKDILSEKLYLLDGERYALHTGENAYSENGAFSVDTFLYARACAVANGKEYFDSVLKNPQEMPKDLIFEALLYLPNEAYEKKTGKELQYVPKYNYETFFNIEGWGLTEARF